MGSWSKICAFSLAAGATLVLASCGQGVKPTSNRISIERASDLCAAVDTAAEVKNLVFEQAEKQTAASNRLALAQLAKQAMLRIEAPLLDSYDDDTRKTTCSGEMHVALPAGAVRNLGDTSDLTAAVKYSAEPATDHIGTDYRVQGAETLISGIAGADITDWASRLQPNGMPAEGAPVPASSVSVSSPPPAPAPAPAVVAASGAPDIGLVAPRAPPTPVKTRRRPGAAPQSSQQFATMDAPPSPRCAWARSYADRTICGDPALEAEDRRIQALFRAALAHDDTGEARRVAQSERGAREGCQDRECIEEWFRQREADLSQR